MYRSTVDVLFNALLLLFWFRIWIRPDDRDTFFNPYLNSIDRYSDALVRFLQPVLMGIPPRIICALSMLFLAIFRGVVFRGMSQPGENSWILVMGLLHVRPVADVISAYLAFSVLSFAIFLFKLWCLSTVYSFVRGGNANSFDHPTVTLKRLSLPFSAIRREGIAPVLLATGALTALAMDMAGTPVPHSMLIGWQHDSYGIVVLRLIVAALSGFADTLLIISNVMFLLIIGSLVATFTSSRGVLFFCKDWLDMLLGPFRRRRIIVGMLDLTPLLFLFAVGIVYAFVMGILRSVYEGIS